MALTKQQIKKLSKNPVQQEYIRNIDAHLCDNGDDFADFANQVAALRKYADHLEEENTKYYQENLGSKKGTFKKGVRHAMNDWDNFDEKKFNKDEFDLENQL